MGQQRHKSPLKISLDVVWISPKKIGQFPKKNKEFNTNHKNWDSEKKTFPRYCNRSVCTKFGDD